MSRSNTIHHNANTVCICDIENVTAIGLPY